MKNAAGSGPASCAKSPWRPAPVAAICRPTRACAWRWTRPGRPTCRPSASRTTSTRPPAMQRARATKKSATRATASAVRRSSSTPCPTTACAPWPRCATPLANMAPTWARKARWCSNSSIAASWSMLPAPPKTTSWGWRFRPAPKMSSWARTAPSRCCPPPPTLKPSRTRYRPPASGPNWPRSPCGPKTPSNYKARTRPECKNCSTRWKISTTPKRSITTLRYEDQFPTPVLRSSSILAPAWSIPVARCGMWEPGMKVLVLGGGGREHAIAWKLSQSPKVSRVYVAPGNGGTALGPKMENVSIPTLPELRQWAQAEKIVLTVVGPEAPLAAGVVDEFRANGLRIFGPTKAAAQLESSKVFAKAFMQRHGIPTADYESFTDPAAAHAFVDRLGAPCVIKADGLAAGKGVVVAVTLQQAHAGIDSMLLDNRYGVTHNAGGARVLIEQFLEGEEASFIVLCDGKDVLALATSQDHKRLKDGDEGPNTGGMGAYSPAPVVTADVHARAMREIILPTIRGMEKDGIPYSGFLYAG